MASSCASRIFLRSFLRKPREVFDAEGNRNILDRSLTLFDLLAIGVGGTVGSGVFVLTGTIAHSYAGPGVVFSWIIGGVCCILSALSYAELSCRMPSAGSTFVYVYCALGELPAVVAGMYQDLQLR